MICWVLIGVITQSCGLGFLYIKLRKKGEGFGKECNSFTPFGKVMLMLESNKLNIFISFSKLWSFDHCHSCNSWTHSGVHSHLLLLLLLLQKAFQEVNVYLFPLLTLGAGFPYLPTYNFTFQHTKSLLIWQLVLITSCLKKTTKRRCLVTWVILKMMLEGWWSDVC